MRKLKLNDTSLALLHALEVELSEVCKKYNITINAVGNMGSSVIHTLNTENNEKFESFHLTHTHDKNNILHVRMYTKISSSPHKRIFPGRS